MLKSLALISILATAAATNAQSPENPAATEQAPAPIVRSFQSNPAPQPDPSLAPDQSGQPDPGPGRAPMQRHSRRPDYDREQTSGQIVDSQPISGVWLRSRSTAVLKTISATPHGMEVRLERGILNVNVHQPATHSEILVDLPGGQTSLLKDGLYTFNADTNTVRVLHGEAAAFPGPSTAANPSSTEAGKPEKGIKIKEDHQLAFAANPAAPGTPAAPAPIDRLKSVEAYPYELAADLLPADSSDGNAYAHVSGSGYAYGDDGPYGYPYYAGGWGYPYGYGYPYGFYPYGVGIGFGYGYYGGFRGGYYGGGFRGGGFRGFSGGGRGFRR